MANSLKLMVFRGNSAVSPAGRYESCVSRYKNEDFYSQYRCLDVYKNKTKAFCDAREYAKTYNEACIVVDEFSGTRTLVFPSGNTKKLS